ncbi:MAG TPA: DUF4861 family protein [Stenotrophomonas sp.]
MTADPATADARVARATVQFVPERMDDLMWENDRIAFRVYGPALQKAEPPSGSGIDVWVKRVRHPFMHNQLHGGQYHVDSGEGLDFYNVGGSRGAGGLGIWDDNKLWVSRNFNAYRILHDGPECAVFELDYAPWPVGVARNVRERRRVSLAMGSQLNRIESTLYSNRPDELIVGIGLNRHATVAGQGVLTQDRAAGLLAYWEPTDALHGTIGTAVLVDPQRVVGFQDDADNHLVLVRVRPGEPLVYFQGAVWDRGLDLHDRQQWEAYLRAYPRQGCDADR